MSIFEYHQKELKTKTTGKDKHIISEIDGLFHKLLAITRKLPSLRSCVPRGKRHNSTCKT